MVRLLGAVHLVLAIVALFLLLGAGSVMAQSPAESLARFISAVLLIYFVVFTLSGVGLVLKKRWGERLAMAAGALVLVEGGFHSLKSQWGLAVFCVSYAALVGWVLFHPGKKKEAGSGGTDPA